MTSEGLSCVLSDHKPGDKTVFHNESQYKMRYTKNIDDIAINVNQFYPDINKNGHKGIIVPRDDEWCDFSDSIVIEELMSCSRLPIGASHDITLSPNNNFEASTELDVCDANPYSGSSSIGNQLSCHKPRTVNETEIAEVIHCIDFIDPSLVPGNECKSTHQAIDTHCTGIQEEQNWNYTKNDDNESDSVENIQIKYNEITSKRKHSNGPHISDDKIALKADQNEICGYNTNNCARTTLTSISTPLSYSIESDFLTPENMFMAPNRVSRKYAEYPAKYNDIIQLHVDHYQNLVDEATQHLRYKEAIALLKKIMLLKPNRMKDYVALSDCYLNLCDMQTSLRYLQRANQLDPTSEDNIARMAFIYYFRGQVLFDQHLFEDAFESFSHASILRPQTSLFRTRELACLAALGRHSECLSLINMKIEKNEKNTDDLYVMRARLHQLYGNFSAVHQDVTKALAINWKNNEARLILSRQETHAEDCKFQGMRYMLQKKYQEALGKFTAAISINPSVADYHLLRGAVYRTTGDFDSAINDFLIAVEKVNHDSTSSTYKSTQRQLLLTYNDFAVECINKKFFDEGIVLLNKAIKVEKNEKGLYINRGDCFFHQDLNYALQDYQQALELDPSDEGIRSRISIVRKEMGDIMFAKRKYNEAELQFTEAIIHNPRVSHNYLSRARMRYLLNNIDGARNDLVITLLLKANVQNTASLLAQLFPGKTADEVMASKLAEQVHHEWENELAKLTVETKPPAIESSPKSDQVLGSVIKIGIDDLIFENCTLAESEHKSFRRSTMDDLLPLSKCLQPNITLAMKSTNNLLDLSLNSEYRTKMPKTKTLQKAENIKTLLKIHTPKKGKHLTPMKQSSKHYKSFENSVHQSMTRPHVIPPIGPLILPLKAGSTDGRPHQPFLL